MLKLSFRRIAVREHWWHVNRPFDDPAGNVLACDFCGLRTRLTYPPSAPCPGRKGEKTNHWLLADGSVTPDEPYPPAPY